MTFKGRSFFNGHFKEISSQTTGIPLLKWTNEIPNDGLIYYNYLFNADRILITNPKSLAEVLVHKSYDFVKPRQLVDSLTRFLGIGLLVAEGEEHKVRSRRASKAFAKRKPQIQRKNLMPAFNFRHVKDLYPIFWSKSCEWTKALSQVSQPEGTESVRNLKDAPIVEIYSWTSRATLDIIGLAGMGQDFNAIQNPTNELINTYKTVFEPSGQAHFLGFLSLFVPFWLLSALPLQRNFDVFQASRTIRRICRQLIDKKKEHLKQREKPVGVDILSVALESGGFTTENLVDQMMTFLAAGHETTAISTTWAVHRLSQNPGVQTRLRDEIRSKLPSIDDAETTMTAQMLDNLPYLHAVCNEVLRVQPPVSMTLREAAKDTSILGTFIPKGTRIILSPYATNMATALWGADAAKFDPDRWLDSARVNAGGNYAFMTFLHGPRSCIGQSFARAEFAFLLAALVGRFEFELEDAERVIEIKGGTARPTGGLPIRLKVVEGW